MGNASAHGPFDNSCRFFLHPDHFDVTVTLGMTGARAVLLKSGIPDAVVSEALKETPPKSDYSLPIETASGFFEAKAAGKLLRVERVSVISDGVEAVFTLHFPRPGAGELELRARYFEAAESLGYGAFIALDEDDHQLGAALLTRDNASVQLSIPLRGEMKSSTTNFSGGVPDGSGSRGGALPVTPDSAAASTVARPSFGEFLRLGITHILKGFDHLLFLGALLVGVRKIGPMLGIITSFTLAHSITLALAALNVVTISPRIVEPLIALSIIVVAVENVIRKDHPADRYWLAGGFGLIHGFGFASVLREQGLAQAGSSIAMPLFSFNLGVEAGQLAVAAAVVPLLFALRRWPSFSRHGTTAISTVVILVSSYWFVERTVFFR